MISIEKLNEVYIRIYADDGIEQELSDFFQFRVENYKFMAAYKSGMWDGFIRLYNLRNKTIYAGLLNYVLKFAQDRGYPVKFLNEVKTEDKFSKEDLYGYAKSLKLHSKGQPIEIHDFQIDAIHKALNDKRMLLISPTASGKSLIIYTIMRLSLIEKRKCLIVVPTISLVNQMYTDFEDYSSENGWSTSNNCQMIMGGFPKVVSSNVVISTWQSIYKQPPSWFKQFDVIFGDECHTFASKSLTGLMEKMTETQYRIGLTGTLKDSKTNKLVLVGCFGEVFQVVTTKELMDSDKVSKLKIKCVIFKHSQEIRDLYKKADYKQEIDYIISNKARNKFIRNLAISTKGNTLVLFTLVEKHGKLIYDLIKEKVGDDRPVFFIHGGVHVDDRENARYIAESVDNAIFVASYGTYQQGINIPSIENIITASPTKSKIRILQSIGRGLRKSKGKTHCNLFDLGDDLTYKKKSNHTLKHMADRIKIYSEEQFDFKILEIDLE